MSRKMLRIPLNERIEKEAVQEPDFLKIFSLYTVDYFTALSKISRELYFAERYEDFIREMEGNVPLSLAECIYNTSNLTREDREFLLYSILVEPFANIAKLERSK